MHLVFDILQGIGVAAAVGIRPFLPALAVGALAAGDVQIDFAHSDFSFLQSAPFLLAMVVGSILLSMLERRMSGKDLERGPVALVISAAAGRASALCCSPARWRGATTRGGRGSSAACSAPALASSPPARCWPGCARRLDSEAAGALPVFTEVVALLAGAAVGARAAGRHRAAGFLLWLLFAGRGRGEQKYAGLRILR